MSDELQPKNTPGFPIYDSALIKGYVEEFQAQQEQARIDKENLISDLLLKGMITPQYALLLNSIHSSTLNSREADLRKVRAAISMKDRLKELNIGKRHAVYIAGAYDWLFPVVLGARNIDMVDPEYLKDGKISTLLQELIDSIKTFDSSPEIKGTPPSNISFEVNTGEGIEKVSLNIFSQTDRDYQPKEPLGTVIEMLGPKSFLEVNSPVLPNVARNMTSDGIILNFDYSHNLYSPESGLKVIEMDDFIVYKISDKSKLEIASNQKSRAK